MNHVTRLFSAPQYPNSSSYKALVGTVYPYNPPVCLQSPMTPRMPQMDLIAELKKRQVKPQVKDGGLEDIITGGLYVF